MANGTTMTGQLVSESADSDEALLRWAKCCRVALDVPAETGTILGRALTKARGADDEAGNGVPRNGTKDAILDEATNLPRLLCVLRARSCEASPKTVTTAETILRQRAEQALLRCADADRAGPSPRQRRPWEVQTDAEWVSVAVPTPDDPMLLLRCGSVTFAIRLADAERAAAADSVRSSFTGLHDASHQGGLMFVVDLSDRPSATDRGLFPRSHVVGGQPRATIDIVDASVKYRGTNCRHHLIIAALLIGHDGSLKSSVRAGDPLQIVIRVPDDEACCQYAEGAVAAVRALRDASVQ